MARIPKICKEYDSEEVIEAFKELQKIFSEHLEYAYCRCEMHPIKEKEMEFDKSKVLTVVTADQLKEGQMGWINDYVDYLKSDTKNISPYKVFRTTGSIYLDFPFEAEHRGVRRYFYPAQEPTIPTFKVGDTVVVQRGVLSTEQEIATVIDPCGKEDFMFVDNNKVRCGLKKHLCKLITYRPFNNDELNDLVGEVLTNKQSGRKKLVTGKPTASEGVNLDGSYINAKDLLASFYRNGNEPCGVKDDD